MRWFLGIPVPPGIARELADRTAHAPVAIGRARLLAAEDLHLTLRFLGELTEARVAAVLTALQPLRQAAFQIDLTGVGAFRSVGAVYAAVLPSRELAALEEAVNETLSWHGFPRELRPFHPHVTLARVRRALPLAQLDRWCATWVPLHFKADRLALFCSRDRVRSFVEDQAEHASGPGDQTRYEMTQTFNFGELPACSLESV